MHQIFRNKQWKKYNESIEQRPGVWLSWDDKIQRVKTRFDTTKCAAADSEKYTITIILQEMHHYAKTSPETTNSIISS